METKISWLKHVGEVIGRILHVVSKDVAPVADQAAAIAEVLVPQFATRISAADNLLDRIVKQAIITEALAATAASPVPGQNKLDALLSGVAPEIDAWVSSRFVGASGVSTAAKAGLVNAVIAITNELEGKPESAILPATSPAS